MTLTRSDLYPEEYAGADPSSAQVIAHKKRRNIALAPCHAVLEDQLTMKYQIQKCCG